MGCVMSFSGSLFALSLIALAAVSLPGKVAGPAAGGGGGVEAAAEQRAHAALEAAGWTRHEGFALTVAGRHPVTPFTAPACPHGLLVGPVAADLDAVPMMARAAGPGSRVIFLHGGTLHEAPPRLAAYAADKAAPLLAALGRAPGADRRVLIGLALTEGCRVESLSLSDIGIHNKLK